MKSISVLIPAYNEKKLLKKSTLNLLDYLRSLKIDFEIIICVNASKDKTEEIAKTLSRKYKEIKYIIIKRKGFGLALIEGIKAAKKEVITYMPADGEVKNGYIGHALHYFPDYDIVLGSRYLSEKYFKQGVHRIFLSITLAFIVRIILSNKISEMGTVKMFRSSWAKQIIKECTTENFEWQIEMTYFALRDKLKIKEIPVETRGTRIQSESKVNLIKDPYSLLCACLKYGSKLKWNYIKRVMRNL